MDTRCPDLHDYHLRLFIIQEVLDGKTIKEAYENFCEVKGENAMEYTEFDFWYYHFYNGNDSLDCYRNQKPKPLTFSDLPTKIVSKLVDDLEPIDQLVLRKVSHYFREIVDDKTITLKQAKYLRKVSHFFQEIVDEKTIRCKHLVLGCYENCAMLCIDRKEMHYRSKEEGCKMIYIDGKKRTKEFEIGGHFLKMAIDAFLVIMKKPKLQLDEMKIGFHVSSKTEKGKQLSKKYLDYIESELKTLNHLIQVKYVLFNVDLLESVLSVLPYLEAGALGMIDLCSDTFERNETVVNKLRTLDHWKQASRICGECLSVPIEDIVHLTHFTGTLKSISSNDLVYIRDVLLRNSKFEGCSLHSEEQIDVDEMKRIFDTVPHKCCCMMFRYTASGTNKGFKFYVKPYSLQIVLDN